MILCVCVYECVYVCVCAFECWHWWVMVTDGDLGARIITAIVTGAYVRKQQTNIRKGKREEALHFIGYGCEAVTWSHVWILIFWQDFDPLALTNVSFTLHPMLRLTCVCVEHFWIKRFDFLTSIALTCACAPDSRRPWRRRRGHSAARSGGNTCRETDTVRFQTLFILRIHNRHQTPDKFFPSDPVL